MLEDRFSAPEIAIRLRRKVKVHIPYLGRDEEIPYAYQNGRLNLITPVTFPENQSALEERASKYALEGQSLFEARDPQPGEMQMLVVGQFESDETEKLGRPDASWKIIMFGSSRVKIFHLYFRRFVHSAMWFRLENRHSCRRFV